MSHAEMIEALRAQAEWRGVDGRPESGGLVLAIVGGQTQRPGIPDRWVAHPKVPGGCWVEVKYGRDVLSAAQRQVMRLMRERGASAVVLRGTRPLRVAGSPITCRCADEEGNPLTGWEQMVQGGAKAPIVELLAAAVAYRRA